MNTNEVITCVREHLDKWYASKNHIETAIQLVNEYEEQIRADERRKFISFIAEHTHCSSNCENILNCDGKKCWNKYLDMYEKEQEE